jgi:hypothetical protein
MRWIHVEHPAGATLMEYTALGVIELFIGGITVRALVALQQGRFLPAPGGQPVLAR